jgi:hypothetical protein
MSNSPLTSQTATGTFATNHGADLRIVMAKRIVNFPAVPAPGDLPAPFTYRMMLDTPFLYLGPGNSLCYEIVMTNNDWAGGITLNMDLAQNNLVKNQVFGGGCNGAALTGTYTVPNLLQSVTGVPANTVAVLMVGNSNETYSGIPLPFDLAGVGGPGCRLFVAPILFLATVTNGNGAGSISLDVSGGPPDLVLQLQVFALSPAANALGLVFTNGMLSSPRAPQHYMRNWTSSIANAAGSLQKVYVLVTEFFP